jgi:putative membrane protein
MSKSDNDTSSSSGGAEKRTDWAEDRTILANERTFASWMRTGMACVGVALGLKAVFGATDHPVVAKSVAELFIVAAVVIFASAARRAFLAQRRIDDHDTTALSHYGMVITAATLAVGAIATGVILWLL